MAHLQLHPRLLIPAGVLALEEMAEEFLLQGYAIVRVEMRPVLEPVPLEPFVLRGGAHERLEVAARMQALAAPVGGRQKRRLHLRPVGHARLPVLAGVEPVRQAVLVEIAADGAPAFLPPPGWPPPPTPAHPAP